MFRILESKLAKVLWSFFIIVMFSALSAYIITEAVFKAKGASLYFITMYSIIMSIMAFSHTTPEWRENDV